MRFSHLRLYVQAQSEAAVKAAQVLDTPPVTIPVKTGECTSACTALHSGVLHNQCNRLQRSLQKLDHGQPTVDQERDSEKDYNALASQQSDALASQQLEFLLQQVSTFILNDNL